jgi:REP element-mobilizing transposase RayT
MAKGGESQRNRKKGTFYFTNNILQAVKDLSSFEGNYTPFRDVLAEGEIHVVHCINRCVRRAYLCGQDPLTGTDYEHRRELIRQRMECLAGIMGIEVLGYEVTSNHFHCVLRSRHDAVATWSDGCHRFRWSRSVRP